MQVESPSTGPNKVRGKGACESATTSVGNCVLIREALEWNITFSVSIKSTRAYIMHFKSLLCENPFEFRRGCCWYRTEISPTAWIFIEVISLESEQLILCHALASRFMHLQLALRMLWFTNVFLPSYKWKQGDTLLINFLFAQGRGGYILQVQLFLPLSMYIPCHPEVLKQGCQTYCLDRVSEFVICLLNENWQS